MDENKNRHNYTAEKSADEAAVPTVGGGGEHDYTPNDADGNTAHKTSAAKKHKPIISSIRRRSTLNYVLYTIVMLALLWIVFFVGFNIFYGSMLEREVRDIGMSAVSAFPKRNDDNSMAVFYRLRLSEIARSNSVEIIVFEKDGDDDYKANITLNALDSPYNSDNLVFQSILSAVDVDKFFSGEGNVDVIVTPRGKFVCYGNSRAIEAADGGAMKLYIIVLQPYELYNSQTLKIVYSLVICTVIVMLLSLLFAFFASRFQTKQLIDFSNKAKMLASGDYSVEFSGYGYVEFENLASALNAAKNNLETSEKLQREIIANVSHDIRTPLTMIRAYAEMLGDMPLDEKKRRNTAGIIIAEADRLTSLIDDVLNYSKLQSGAAEFVFDTVDMDIMASSVLARFDIFRERNGIKFISEIDKKSTVRCDQQRLEQVLYNLITNAVNYCGEDKIIILRVKNNGESVRVEVTDHGQGIAPEDIESVWDRYYRVARTKRTTVGSGLGLSICKNILTAHDAKYGVDSQVGKGSTFWFELALVKR